MLLNVCCPCHLNQVMQVCRNFQNQLCLVSVQYVLFLVYSMMLVFAACFVTHLVCGDSLCNFCNCCTSCFLNNFFYADHFMGS